MHSIQISQKYKKPYKTAYDHVTICINLNHVPGKGK